MSSKLHKEHDDVDILDPTDVDESAMIKAVHADEKAVALLRNAFPLAQHHNEIDDACMDDYSEGYTYIAAQNLVQQAIPNPDMASSDLQSYLGGVMMKETEILK